MQLCGLLLRQNRVHGSFMTTLDLWPSAAASPHFCVVHRWCVLISDVVSYPLEKTGGKCSGDYKHIYTTRGNISGLDASACSGYSLPMTRYEQLMNQGVDAEEANRLQGAAVHYLHALQLDPSHPVPYLFLAHALLRAGKHDNAAQVASLGYEVNPAVLNSWRGRGVNSSLAVRSRLVNEAFRRHMSALHATAVSQAEKLIGETLPRLQSAIWCQTHQHDFAYRDSLQSPWLLYLPDLKPQPWFDTGSLPGAAGLADAVSAIEQEARALLDSFAVQRQPYLRAGDAVEPGFAPLHGSSRWDSLHLYRAGQPAEMGLLKAAPVIHAAVQQLDCTRLGAHPMELFLSVLAPKTAIPPHHGLANTRLTVHLPLSVPDDCALKVGDEVREAVRGRVLAFDDSYLHEAWNRSALPRVHLITETWRPDLSEAEKCGLQRCVDSRDAWNRARGLPAMPGD
jgi:tetratricopeptide (TPR) repeat protein